MPDDIPPSTPDNPSPEDLALEARLVAMVLGEASDFEKAELEKILSERPDLQAFTRRIAEIHRAADQACEQPQKGDPWKLSKSRRETLLQLFGEAEKPERSESVKPKKRVVLPLCLQIALPVAAAVILLLVIAGVMMPRFSKVTQLSDHGISNPGALEHTVSIEALAMDLEEQEEAPVRRIERAAPVLAEVAPQSLPGSVGGRLARVDSPSQPQVTRELAKAEAKRAARLRQAPATEALKDKLAATEPAAPMPTADQHRLAVAVAAPRVESNLISAPPPGTETMDPAEFSLGIATSLRRGSDADRKKSAAAGAGINGPAILEEPAISALFKSRTQVEPASTFSLHVADVSFRLASEALLKNNTLPDPAKIRPEEFTAAFDYGDPSPAPGEPVALAQDQSAHPFLTESNLLRISLRTAAAGRGPQQGLNLILLLDKSGSMERPDRAAATRQAIAALDAEMKPADQVTVVTFDRTAQLVADRAPGAEIPELLQSIQAAAGDSGTNLEAAMGTITAIARERYQPGAINRVLLITDGIANLGANVPDTLAREVEQLRNLGFAFDAVAVGSGGEGDAVLEAMARDGDGRYFLLQDGDADAAEFASQLAGAFRPAASNVKIQIRFNPSRVAAWSLLGFDEHRLEEEDFRDDSVDAAELAAAEQGSALYQLKLVPDGSGEIGQVSVRFRETATGQMVERTWTIPYSPAAPPFDEATPAHQLAGVATLFAESLRQSPTGSVVDLERFEEVLPNLRSRYNGDPTVLDLIEMVNRAVRLRE